MLVMVVGVLRIHGLRWFNFMYGRELERNFRNLRGLRQSVA